MVVAVRKEPAIAIDKSPLGNVEAITEFGSNEEKITITDNTAIILVLNASIASLLTESRRKVKKKASPTRK